MTRTWTVSEATHSTAFLSDAEGHDIATLQRMPCELYDTDEPLTESEWQSVIDLVAAAPALLRALKRLVPWKQAGEPCKPPQGWGEWADAIAAINTAEGKDRIPHEQ